MDLHLIVDGLEDSKRTNDVLAEVPPPNKSPTKPLRRNIETLPNADATVCAQPSSPQNIGMSNISTKANANLKEWVSHSGVVQSLMENPSNLPDRYCHPKHFNPPIIASSHQKKASRTKTPVGVIGDNRQMQYQPRGISPTRSPPVNSPVGRGEFEIPTYSADFMNYPSPPENTPDISHVRINQTGPPAYHGVQVMDELPIAVPAQNSPYTTAAIPYYAATHTSPNYQNPAKPEATCINTRDPSPAYIHVYKNSIPSEYRQHRTKILLDNTNYSSKSWKFQLKRTANKPVVSTNLVNEYIMFFDADTNTILPDKRVSTSKNIKHGCKQCGRIFLRKCDLVRHIQMHLGIRPNVCGICGKRFIQRSALTIHLRVHTGEKPFSCLLCGRAFSDSSSLARHRHTHNRNAKQFADRMKDSQYRA